MRAAPYCPGNTPPWYGRFTPAESTRYTIGMRWRIAISWARSIFLIVSGHQEPAFTVASFATTTTGRPAIRPRPVTTPAPGACPSYWSNATSRPISNQAAPWSSRAATRSRAVSFPWSCWRRTLSGPPPCSRRALSPASAAEPHQAGEPVHDAACPFVVHDVDLNVLGQGLLDGIVDAAVVVLPVGEQRAHLAALECLERRLDAVHRPAAADAFPHGLRVCALPGSLALLAQRERRLAHFGGGDALGVQPDHAEHEVVQIGVQMRQQGGRIHADAGDHEPGERALGVDLEDTVRHLRVVALPLLPDAHVIVVLAEAPGQHVSPFRLPPAVELPRSRGLCGQAGQLDDVIGRHLEEARAGAVARRDEDGAEFLLERHELPHQGHGRHGEPRAVDMGKRQHLEQVEGAAGKQRDPPRRG